MKKNCPQCNKEFSKPINESKKAWQFRHKFCSKNCKNLSQKETQLGNTKGFKKGHIPFNKNTKGLYKLGTPTLEHRKKLAVSKMGDKNPAWNNGSSFVPYTVDWTKTLRQSIRERDFYTCQLCKKPQGDETLSVHHIDYDKKNCDPKNLIALCNSCHIKTNHNRSYWLALFKQSTVA